MRSYTRPDITEHHDNQDNHGKRSRLLLCNKGHTGRGRGPGKGSLPFRSETLCSQHQCAAQRTAGAHSRKLITDVGRAPRFATSEGDRHSLAGDTPTAQHVSTKTALSVLFGCARDSAQEA